MNAEELNIIKAGLIDEWSKLSERIEQPSDAAHFQSIATRRSRGGFAVGHGHDAKGRVWLELRVTAKGGPNFRRAERLRAKASAEGLKAVLKVIRAPIIYLKGAGAGARFGGRREPLHIGASVAHEDGFAGTLGAFVKIEGVGSGILSCAHVLANAGGKRAYEDDPIQQPGSPEPICPGNRIGKLTKMFSLLSSAHDQNLDAAIALLDDKVQHQGNFLPADGCVPQQLRGKPIGQPLGEGDLNVGEAVFKVGRTTGFTEGTISALSFQNLHVVYGSSRREFVFAGVHEIQWDGHGSPFTAPGDSGSLIMTGGGFRPVGLHFSAVSDEHGNSASYVVPWGRIYDTFKAGLL